MSDMLRVQDDELMLRIIQRDESALTELYQLYGNAVYSVALRVCGGSEWAEEVTQDTFFKVWHQSERWDAQRGKLIVWLLTITKHAAIDYIRREQRKPQLAGVSLDDISESLGKNSLMDDPAWQDHRLMARLITELPEEQAEAIRLAFYQGLSHSAIAEELNLPLGTVKTRVRLGMQKLKSLWLIANQRQNE
ncbi:MAG TPA: sigma-70 family RNA polymerase sigma factor [Phototrophicaceae bacterium]|jgi:RNA polymerase sigma-70 factor (ECF subfamily)|nr:sigma-70 family RNA polymerase sigma factor [Phototrophicaceae bacterium]